MNRRDFIGHTATLGVIAAAVTTLPASVTSVGSAFAVFPDAGRLTPPAKGKIPVAFAISWLSTRTCSAMSDGSDSGWFQALATSAERH